MLQSISEQLQHDQIRFVRLLWCDNANIIRAKAFHISRLAEHLQHGIGVSMAQQAVPALYDAVVPDSGLGPVGEAWLVPDWSTYSALPYAPGHARVIADLHWQNQPWSLCPRAFLKRQIAAAQRQNLQVMAAFEHEFYLLYPPLATADSLPAPVDRTPFAATLAMDLQQPVIDDIAEALIAQEIPVERYYPESGPGQHELSIRYTNALQAADWQVVFRETVRGVALQHGLRASFLPKIFADQAGSGCHLHLSLWQAAQNLMPDAAGTGLSAIALHWIGGLLHHLPALMAITTPSPNSYRRLQPHCWSGAYKAWGVDNREAAVRVPSGPVPPYLNRVELKTVDAAANPYLALGGAIAAGLDGIAQKRSPGDPVTVDPGSLTEADRLQQGIERLPASLGEAIAHLRQDAVLLEALGPELARAFLAVRQAEWLGLKEAELTEEVRLLLERY